MRLEREIDIREVDRVQVKTTEIEEFVDVDEARKAVRARLIGRSLRGNLELLGGGMGVIAAAISEPDLKHFGATVALSILSTAIVADGARNFSMANKLQKMFNEILAFQYRQVSKQKPARKISRQ